VLYFVFFCFPSISSYNSSPFPLKPLNFITGWIQCFLSGDIIKSDLSLWRYRWRSFLSNFENSKGPSLAPPLFSFIEAQMPDPRLVFFYPETHLFNYRSISWDQILHEVSIRFFVEFWNLGPKIILLLLSNQEGNWLKEENLSRDGEIWEVD
jgi:hypothetical protein